MKVILTGGAGFLGSHIRAELESHGHEVVVLDRKVSHGHDLRYRENVTRLFMKHVDADVCIHLAAKVGRLLCEEDPQETIDANLGMTALVARVCAQAEIKLVYASSSEAYGDNGETVCDEYDGPFSLPHNLYGITKGMGEDICKHYGPDDLTVLRFSMPYGPQMPHGYGRAAIINMLHCALERKPISVHRGAERSWCYVEDTARAVRLVLESGYLGWLNVGRDDAPVPMKKVASLACELAGAPTSLIEEIDPPQMQSVVKRLSTKRIYELGWSPRVGLREGMERTLDWLRL